MINILKKELSEISNIINLYPIDKENIIFEERVLMNCFYCSKYNTQWTCPPNIPKIDYKKMICEYDNIFIVGASFEVNKNNYDEIRSKSTNQVHHILLKLEKILWDNNYPMAISFIGGSCKLCKNGCAKDKCRNSKSARIPIEATGINVIKSLSSIGIKLNFANKKEISRYGMLLY